MDTIAPQVSNFSDSNADAPAARKAFVVMFDEKCNSVYEYRVQSLAQ